MFHTVSSCALDSQNSVIETRHVSEGWLADWLLVTFHIVSVCALYSPNSVIQTRHVSEGWLADWSLVMFHVVSICALDSPNSVIQTRGEKKNHLRETWFGCGWGWHSSRPSELLS